MKHYHHRIRGRILISVFAALMVWGPAMSGAEEPCQKTGRFFMGALYGTQDTEMRTEFVRHVNGTLEEVSHFKNGYSSDIGGLFLGYTFPWGRWYLSGQGYFNHLSDEFVLHAGSSRFVNALNHTFGADLMPGVYVMDRVSVFGKLGWVRGDFDFDKTSPTATQYHVSTHLDGYTVGGGVAWDLSRDLTLKLGYEKTRYEDVAFVATLGNVLHDLTRVKPRSDTVFITLQYHFN